MDKIFLNELTVEAIVGIWDWERQIPQTIVIDLEMAADIRRAAEADSIDATLDYKLVAKSVQRLVEESRFRLVETMAQAIADLVIGEFGVPWVKVRVNKPGAIRGAKDVGVVIERGNPG